MDVVRLLVLGAVCVVAYAVGELAARAHVPRLPVYLAVGAAAGLIVKNLSETVDLAFPVLNPMALCIIGFIAGSHLVWTAIRPRIRPITYQVAGMVLVVPTVVGVAAYFALPAEVPHEVRLAASILAGTVMLALSPPEAIAIISESRAVGPFTRLVLGATVVMDVVVVSAFSVAMTLAKSLLGESVSTAELIVTVLLGVALAALAGAVVGWLLRRLVEGESSDVAVISVIVVLAGIAAAAAVLLKRFAHARWGLELEIESLLIAMIAGLLVANTSKRPERFAELLERIAPYVYVVFFTMTGLGLHLETLVAAAVPALIIWVLRAAGMWAGSTAAMVLAKEDATVRRVAWRAFIPQAGIALALASTISAEFPKGGPALSAVIIGTIVLNEATGPFFLRSALVATGEAVPEGEMLD